jgi:hypothetical protein
MHQKDVNFHLTPHLCGDARGLTQMRKPRTHHEAISNAGDKKNVIPGL